jgi:hypothetical protein
MSNSARASLASGIFLLLQGVFLTSAHSQSHEFVVHPESFGARGLGTGDVSVSDGFDASGMYWNPAGLEFLMHFNPVVSSKLDANSQTLKNGLAIPIRLGSAQVMGVGLVGSYFGTTYTDPYFASYGVDLAFATRIYAALSAGVMVNIRNGRGYFGQVSPNLVALAGSVGLLYSPNPGLSYGITFRGIGSGMIFSREDDLFAMHYERQLPQSIDAGLTFRYPSSTAPVFVLSMGVGKNLSQSVMTNKAGIEILPFRFLSLRMGIVSSGSQSEFRSGIGFSFFSLYVDYGIAFHSSTGEGQELSISIPIFE